MNCSKSHNYCWIKKNATFSGINLTALLGLGNCSCNNPCGTATNRLSDDSKEIFVEVCQDSEITEADIVAVIGAVDDFDVKTISGCFAIIAVDPTNWDEE